MKRALSIVLAAMVLWLVNTLPADAVGGSRGRSAVHGHSEIRGHRGSREGHRIRNHQGVRERHRVFESHRFQRHHGMDSFVGWGFWWPFTWWGPIPSRDVEPGALVPQVPPVYIQQPPQYYWYYCTNPPGYYPYVQQCPSGWMTVMPPASEPVR